MHENRETSKMSARETGADRREKASRTARMHVEEESDCGVVPVNCPNQEEQSSAEGGEGRPQTKESASPSCTLPTQGGEGVSQGLTGVRKAARGRKEGREVHGTATSSDGGATARELLWLEARSRCRDRRSDLEGIRDQAGRMR
jgi:hypothetical protein